MKENNTKKKLINLKYYKYWKEPFEKLINELFPEEVISEILSIYPFRETYYDKIQKIIGNYRSLSQLDEDYMIAFMEKNYDYVIGYHATKLSDIDIPIKQGLKTLTKTDYINLSSNLFSSIASDIEILNAVNKFDKRITEMKIEFTCYKNRFQDDFSCSFLIYGSETLLFIANVIDQFNCRKVLRDMNIPVIYKCKIPLKYITENHIAYLFKSMICRVFSKMQNKKIIFDNHDCFEINRNYLEAKYVVQKEIIYRRMKDCYYDKCFYQYKEL